MIVARIFQFIMVGLLLTALFSLGALVFFITICVLLVLGVVGWLRKKGILTGRVSSTYHPNTTAEPEVVIEGEFHEVSGSVEKRKD